MYEKNKISNLTNYFSSWLNKIHNKHVESREFVNAVADLIDIKKQLLLI